MVMHDAAAREGFARQCVSLLATDSVLWVLLCRRSWPDHVDSTVDVDLLHTALQAYWDSEYSSTRSAI